MIEQVKQNIKINRTKQNIFARSSSIRACIERQLPPCREVVAASPYSLRMRYGTPRGNH